MADFVKRNISDSRTPEDINNNVQALPSYMQYPPLSELSERRRKDKSS